MEPRRVVIGQVTRPHGVRGEMRIASLSDHPDRFSRLERVWLRRGAGTKLAPVSDTAEPAAYDVERCRQLGKAVGLKLRGVESPEAVAALRGYEILADPLPPDSLPDGTYYVDDVVGMLVETGEGTSLGTVAEVMKYPANDVLRVVDGETERLLPMVHGIVEVDVDRRTIVVNALPGLLEL